MLKIVYLFISETISELKNKLIRTKKNTKLKNYFNKVLSLEGKTIFSNEAFRIKIQEQY